MISVVKEPKHANEISFEQREKELKVLEKMESENQRQDRKSPYSSFYQVNKDNSDYLRSCLKESPRALEILLFIFQHMDKYNAVMCSYKVFQESLGMGKATVARAIKYLKEHGFLYVYKTGTSNVYVANNNLVWNSWGNNLQYCKFPANIILSASEQEDHANAFNKRVTAVEIKESKN